MIPVGSTEQHGPTGIFATDFLTAWKIAEEAGFQSQTLVASPLNYGMAVHHLGFPGSMALRPDTYKQVIVDLCESLIRAGFKKLIFVNGHGGNINPIHFAFIYLKTIPLGKGCNFYLYNWYEFQNVQNYEKEHFGDENGHHATPGEVSVTMHLDPTVMDKKTGIDFKVTHDKYQWPMSPEEFREKFPDGRMQSNPNLATPEHGKNLFNLAVQSMVEVIQQKL